MMIDKYIALLLAIILLVSCQDRDGDYLIKGANVYDGLGGPPVLTDVLIADGEIAYISTGIVCSPCEVIEGEGLALAPGFVDLHAHLEPLPIIPDAESAIHMGVTTALGGPDGSSPLPIGRYLDSMETMGVGINVAYLIGHNSVRLNVMQLENRDPTDEEMDEMIQQVQAGMYEGAYGISTGLKYLPGAYSKTEEVITLSRHVAELGGIYTSHLREEGLDSSTVLLRRSL